jgi:hypothetical protein
MSSFLRAFLLSVCLFLGGCGAAQLTEDEEVLLNVFDFEVRTSAISPDGKPPDLLNKVVRLVNEKPCAMYTPSSSSENL